MLDWSARRLVASSFAGICTALTLSASAPAAMKYRRGGLKRLLVGAFRDRLPAALLSRPKKGFSIPVDAWFRGPLRPLAADAVGSPTSRLRDWLRPDTMQRYLAEHAAGTLSRGPQLWALVMLELWLRQLGDAGGTTSHGGPAARA